MAWWNRDSESCLVVFGVQCGLRERDWSSGFWCCFVEMGKGRWLTLAVPHTVLDTLPSSCHLLFPLTKWEGCCQPHLEIRTQRGSHCCADGRSLWFWFWIHICVTWRHMASSLSCAASCSGEGTMSGGRRAMKEASRVWQLWVELMKGLCGPRAHKGAHRVSSTFENDDFWKEHYWERKALIPQDISSKIYFYDSHPSHPFLYWIFLFATFLWKCPYPLHRLKLNVYSNDLAFITVFVNMSVTL